MLETVHVAVWLLVVVALALGALAAVAWKNHVAPKAEATTLLGEVEAKVSGFDAAVYSTIRSLESEGKADLGAAAKYLEGTVGVVLKKL